MFTKLILVLYVLPAMLLAIFFYRDMMKKLSKSGTIGTVSDEFVALVIIICPILNVYLLFLYVDEFRTRKGKRRN